MQTLARGGGLASVLAGWAARMAAELGRAQAQVNSETIAFTRACKCGAWFEHERVSPAAARHLARIWSELHRKPGCAPLSAVAAFELRHELARWWGR